MPDSAPQQLLHLVIGGELVDLEHNTFKNLDDVEIVGLYPNYAAAHVAWRATYARKDGPDVVIDFDIHYLVQKLGDEPKVFGWVSGDEEAVLKAHGIV